MRGITWPRVLMALAIVGTMLFVYVLFIAPKVYVSFVTIDVVPTRASAAGSAIYSVDRIIQKLSATEFASLVWEDEAVVEHRKAGRLDSYSNIKEAADFATLIANSLTVRQTTEPLAITGNKPVARLKYYSFNGMEAQLLIEAIPRALQKSLDQKEPGQFKVHVVSRTLRAHQPLYARLYRD